MQDFEKPGLQQNHKYNPWVYVYSQAYNLKIPTVNVFMN